MRSISRGLLLLLLLGALSLGNVPSVLAADVAHGLVESSSSGASHAPSHDDDSGLAGHELAVDCCVPFCGSVFGIQPGREQYQASWTALKFGDPFQDRNIRSDVSDGDPPVPRFSS